MLPLGWVHLSRHWKIRVESGCVIRLQGATSTCSCSPNADTINLTGPGELSFCPVWVDATFIEYKRPRHHQGQCQGHPGPTWFWHSRSREESKHLFACRDAFSQLCSQINSWLFDFTMMFCFVLFFSALLMQRSSWSQRTPTTWHSSLKQHKYKLWSHYRHLNMWISLLRLLWEEPRYLRLTLGDGGSPFLLMGSWWAFFFLQISF